MSQFVVPLKTLAHRFTYSVLIVASLTIIMLGKADVLVIERTRAAVADAFAPALEALSQPASVVTAAIDRVHDVIAQYNESGRLREENDRLRQWQAVAHRLEIENAELRGLLNFPSDSSAWYITGRVIGTAGGAFKRSVLVNRGANDGVAKGQAAASGVGLIGRVAEVGARTSRVLLLTDRNSLIPVELEGSHEKAILSGDNSDRPQLLYLPAKETVAPGDRVVTSGDGGIFPPGILVGTVASIDGGLYRVQPASELSRVELLRLVDYGLSGVLPPTAVPLPKAPPVGRRGAKAAADPGVAGAAQSSSAAETTAHP
ncbi:MAG TPA: rod shape-determining protein MreC [Stellaceae bacterium]|nr:rod shape-determining protein MreC [Stellaceae bacterium]